MLATLYYEPLWVFYRGKATLSQLNQLKGMRIAVGARGSGTRAFVGPLLEFNAVRRDNSTLLPIGGDEAMRALQADEVDAVLLVGGAETPIIVQALRDPAIKLLSFARADAYVRRFPYITRLTLPAGTIDLALEIPAGQRYADRNQGHAGGPPRLASRTCQPPARRGKRYSFTPGVFRSGGRVPGIAPVDLPVSADAERHKRYGPSFLHRYLPFWVATFVERFVILGAAADCDSGPGHQLFSGFHSLAGSVARLPVVRRAGVARARRGNEARHHFPSRNGCRTSIASSARWKTSRCRPVSRARPTRFASTSRWFAAPCWQGSDLKRLAHASELSGAAVG